MSFKVAELPSLQNSNSLISDKNRDHATRLTTLAKVFNLRLALPNDTLFLLALCRDLISNPRNVVSPVGALNLILQFERY